jgi:hypothetical protein
VLAVTGSNGKSTVSALTGELVRAAGLSAAVIGNIGEPVLDALAEHEGGAPLPDVFVLELSSLQLETTRACGPIGDRAQRHRQSSRSLFRDQRVRSGEGARFHRRREQGAQPRRCTMSRAPSSRTVQTFAGAPATERLSP